MTKYMPFNKIPELVSEVLYIAIYFLDLSSLLVSLKETSACSINGSNKFEDGEKF